ncbi:MAG: efflux RND transporter permease subunit [Candidatus Saccharibacteria bacterium]
MPKKKIKNKKIAKLEDKQPTKLQRFSLFFFDRIKTSLTIWIAVVIFGVLSYAVFLQRQGFPGVNLPFSIVNGAYFVDNQQKVDQDIAIPASKAIAKIPEVKTATATSGKNFVTIQIEYVEGTDSKVGSDKVQKQVEAIGLPKAAQLRFQNIDFTKFDNKYNLLIAAFGKEGTSAQTLKVEAKAIAKAVSSAEGVSGASVLNQFEVARNPVTGEEQTQQKTFDRTATKSGSELQFHDSVSVGVVAKEGTDTLKLYDNVKKILNERDDSAIKTVITGTEAENVREQIHGLQQSLIEGLIIVAIISLLLISWRAGIATSISMGTVLLATIGGLKLFGYSLNTITLFALILSLALIVDDTTIVAEAIDAGQKDGMNKREIVALAVKRVARASTTGTLVTMLAFAPMIFIGGILGSFIRALPITIIISLGFSLLVSLSLIPFLARHLILTDTSKPKHKSRNPIIRLEHIMSTGLASLVSWTRGNSARKSMLAVSAIILGVGSLFASFGFFGKLKFDIFPPTKDGNEMLVTVRFAPGTDIVQAKSITDKANAIMTKTLGQYGQRIDYKSQANSAAASAHVTLTHYQDRSITAPVLQKKMAKAFDGFKGASVKVSVSGAGGPADDQPFKVQIDNDKPEVAAKISADMIAFLNNTTFERSNKTSFRVIDAISSDAINVTRKNGKRIFEVKAGFDATDVTALVTVTKTAVQKEFSAEKLASYGLSREALQFDFGNESNNQDSFKSMIMAFPVLILLMLILLVIQFKSLLQPLLILLAIPFSFLGVAVGLYITDNTLSFFVMIGFFALIGIAVNNTIMLVDYANQALRTGASHTDAMAEAVRHRFRPLLTTSVTSVVALIPLAISDPFWQPLAVTLISGLISSTFLVIVAFPYFWLIAEWIRGGTKRGFRKVIRKS